jgi:polyhydroxyalkanoate synthesis regulator phasin
MDEPDNDGGVREAAEKLLLAAVGAVTLTGDRAEALADELAERGAARRDEVADALADVATRWRGDALRVSERAGAGLAGLFRDLGLVTRDELDALELRVAQLEHRVRLLEDAGPFPP